MYTFVVALKTTKATSTNHVLTLHRFDISMYRECDFKRALELGVSGWLYTVKSMGLLD